VRIAYVVTRADAVGGATIHVMEMARAMLARGHQAAIFTGGHGEAADKLAESGAPVHSLRYLRRPVNPLRDALAFRELTAALSVFRPQLISAHTAKAGWLGRAAAARLDIPAIYTPHGLPVGARMAGAQGRIFEAAERLASRWARRIVCVSESERRLAVERALASPERLVVIHNGVHDIPPALRANPSAQPPQVVSVARFEAPKDHATLLRAMAQLEGLPWSLDLVGGGPEESDCRALAEKLGIAGRVRFLGYQSDVAPALAAAQVFVLSTRSEAMPRSALEALRAGLPVIASDIGGLPEIVSAGVDGMLVPAEDPQALAAALRDLLTDAGLRERYGAAARAAYERSFRIEEMIAKTVALYEALLTPAS
jgi:glycosyltransferase involved in cell wall biosynthesis